MFRVSGVSVTKPSSSDFVFVGLYFGLIVVVLLNVETVSQHRFSVNKDGVELFGSQNVCILFVIFRKEGNLIKTMLMGSYLVGLFTTQVTANKFYGLRVRLT